MIKAYYFLFIAFQIFSFGLSAQSITVPVAPTASDSAFVIHSGVTDSFHVGNHPGAGGYTNARIFICSGGTLKYNFPMSTSSQPTFYLDNGATLIANQDFFAPIYMKENAIFNANGNFAYVFLRRLSTSVYMNLGAGSNILMDSIYANINYTFTGWPNNQNPCNLPTALEETVQTDWTPYPNPVHSSLEVPKVSGGWWLCTLDGRVYLTTNTDRLDLNALNPGLYLLHGAGKTYKIVKE